MEKWQDPNTLALWFGIVIFFVLLLVTAIIILVRINYEKILKRSEEEAATKIRHQRELLESNLSIQEKERDRIAADLHDSLIGKLTAIRLKNQIDSDKEEVDRMMSESIVEARRITHDLSPPLVEITPIDEIIKELSEPWARNFEVNYRIDMRADFELETRSKVQIMRIFQEVLTNISKHAKATKIEIGIRQTEELLLLYIKDNGKGIDEKKIKRGLGLRSIESRVQYIKATYKVRSTLNSSTSFSFLLKKNERNNEEKE